MSRWLLWLGTLAALAALLSGYWASNSVQHDDLGHANMLVHRNGTIAAAALFGIVALFEFWRRNRTRASVISALLLLAGGDAEGVRSLMAEDVQIFESGNVEASLEEYSGHHLPADMAFMGAMDSEIIARRVIENGDLATVLTRYRLQGRYKGQDINTVTTETLVLRKMDGAWRIVHVHGSSG